MTAHVEQVADEIWYAIRDMILFQKKKKGRKDAKSTRLL